MALPDFFIIGPPKAGTSALHRALSFHPQLHLSRIKEPKFFLSPGVRPHPSGQRGPGDAHSAQEWVWRTDRYAAQFASAPSGSHRGESTPFYLYDHAAQTRIAEAVPDARLIAVLRDPVDRAYSNWMHLWSDGLEPQPDFVAACEAEDARIEAGFAPFWHYRRLGLYGRQLKLTSVRDDQLGQNAQTVQASLSSDKAFATFVATSSCHRGFRLWCTYRSFTGSEGLRLAEALHHGHIGARAEIEQRTQHG